LEDIVGRIDTPALGSVTIIFFNQLVFDTPLLRDFFSRTEVFRELRRAEVIIVGDIGLALFRLEGTVQRCMLDVTISSMVTEWQVSSLAQFCSSSLPPLPTLECLTIEVYIHLGLTQALVDDMERSQWFELFHPFVAVRALVPPRDFRVANHIATALRELSGDTVTEVLPALRRVIVNGFYVDRIQEAFAPFITARQLSGHPVSIHPWPVGVRRSR
jgi:hypothetical protein